MAYHRDQRCNFPYIFQLTRFHPFIRHVFLYKFFSEQPFFGILDSDPQQFLFMVSHCSSISLLFYILFHFILYAYTCLLLSKSDGYFDT